MKTLNLIPLPYSSDNLEPIISRKIVELHHDKHQAAYVNGANLVIEKLGKYRKGEMEINVRETMRDLSFNLNGVRLHELFWQNMDKAKEDNLPQGDTKKIIEKSFGSFEAFRKEFSSAAVSVEGSGWAVVWKNQEGDLAVGQIEKHNLLGLNGWEPILVCDVWEHAYYLDYLNNRAEFVEKWWKLVAWDRIQI